MRKVTHLETFDYPLGEAEFLQLKLSVFERHCQDFADRVAVGRLRLADAADMLQSAAELSGLSDAVGDDVVQQYLAAAFIGKRAERADG